MSLQQRIDEATRALRDAIASHPSVAFATSFGAEDMVLLDLIDRLGLALDAFTLDTGRLHEETYALMDEARRRYRTPVRVMFPDAAQVEAAVRLGARQVEFHTGPYAHAKHGEARKVERAAIAEAARLAKAAGLEVAAGHGLTRANVVDIASIAEVEELNIGHAIVSDAVLMGMPRAVRTVRSAIRRGVRQR